MGGLLLLELILLDTILALHLPTCPGYASDDLRNSEWILAGQLISPDKLVRWDSTINNFWGDFTAERNFKQGCMETAPPMVTYLGYSLTDEIEHSIFGDYHVYCVGIYASGLDKLVHGDVVDYYTLKNRDGTYGTKIHNGAAWIRVGVVAIRKGDKWCSYPEWVVSALPSLTNGKMRYDVITVSQKEIRFVKNGTLFDCRFALDLWHACSWELNNLKAFYYRWEYSCIPPNCLEHGVSIPMTLDTNGVVTSRALRNNRANCVVVDSITSRAEEDLQIGCVPFKTLGSQDDGYTFYGYVKRLISGLLRGLIEELTSFIYSLGFGGIVLDLIQVLFDSVPGLAVTVIEAMVVQTVIGDAATSVVVTLALKFAISKLMAIVLS